MIDRSDNRRHERDSLFLVADLRLERDGAPYEVKLRNISDSGVMAEGNMRVARGTRVYVELRNIGIVGGQVAWAAGNRCGIAFDSPIRAADVQFPVAEIDIPESEGTPEQLSTIRPSERNSDR